MLKQLQGLVGQRLYNLGATILVEQALFLALAGKIPWSRVNQNELCAEVPLALPGQDPVPVKVIFWKSYSDEGGMTAYLNLGEKTGPCRNSADKNVAFLAEQFFEQTAKAA